MNTAISSYVKGRLASPGKAVILLGILMITFLLVTGAATGRAAAQDRDPARKKVRKETEPKRETKSNTESQQSRTGRDETRAKRKTPDTGKNTRKERTRPDRKVYRKDRGESGRKAYDNVVRRPKRPKGPTRPADPPTPNIYPPGHGHVKPPRKIFYPPHHHYRPPYVEIILIDRFLPGYGDYTDPVGDGYFEGSIDENNFIIALPFGSILPWEVGEDFLAWLRSLEDSGHEMASVVCIIQTMEPMVFDDFLERFGREAEEILYYDTLSDRTFLVAAPVMSISRLLSDTGIRWIGEYLDEYKVVPGGRGPKIFISSLEGDRDEFRADLEASGVKIMRFKEDTGEYVVFGDHDNASLLAGFWWVSRISGRPSLREKYLEDYGSVVPDQ